ncbi:MAG: hypothetical protein IKD18_06360 [Clostridia bacterium]|nr:hypothetical protein [Clostridia bacterium]
MLPGINIRSVIAGVHKWRRRYPYVYLNRPGIPQQPDNTAYPLAAAVVRSCCESARELGMPEAQIPLTHAALLLATAPKSNSSEAAIQAAMADVNAGKGLQIPPHLQSPLFKNYKYPHDFPNHYVEQQYLPLDLPASTHYYSPGENKNEQAAADYWKKIKG